MNKLTSSGPVSIIQDAVCMQGRVNKNASPLLEYTVVVDLTIC